MKVELFSFQRNAVINLRAALETRKNSTINSLPAIISLQAPTGAGKTIIMSTFIEEAFFGSDYDTYGGDPDRIFVWLSDSPALNEQSKLKIESKADRIKLNQCVTIDDNSFDMETLDEGHVYFLNTQKLGKSGNLGKHSDTRQYTIWETLDNTARTKADKLIVIIDEAHRGMQGKDAARATSIMQRFLIGYEDKMCPMPFVIGMSATAERFQKLTHKIIDRSFTNIVVYAEQVRSSGLLKDRIIISYPEDTEKTNPSIVLKKATQEWIDKCNCWYRYCHEQHYAQVHPIFVIQVESSRDKDSISSTDLDNVLKTIEEEYGGPLNESEVVHTFGSTGTIYINGLKVEHIQPEDIVNDPRIKVVFFKENLSTGWDCPRAEALMSYRHAEDATYIAQLLGRMIRTPQQRRVLVDDSLNEVRLFLPYFNKDTVQKVIYELSSSECGDLPADLESETTENRKHQTLTTEPKRARNSQTHHDQPDLFDDSEKNSPYQTTKSVQSDDASVEVKTQTNSDHSAKSGKERSDKPIAPPSAPKNNLISNLINRKEIVSFINKLALPTSYIKSIGKVDYLRLAEDLSSILSQLGLYKEAEKSFKNIVIEMIHSNAQYLETSGYYSRESDRLNRIKMLESVFDSLGQPIPSEYKEYDLFSSGLLDAPAKLAENILGNAGIVNEYIRSYQNEKGLDNCRIDCILFANTEDCMRKLREKSKQIFFDLHNKYRRYVVNKSDKEQEKYNQIIKAGTTEVSELSFRLPNVLICEKSGDTFYSDHLYVDEDGKFEAKLNEWEISVLNEERRNKNFVTWYRNLKGSSGLGIAYQMDGKWRMFYPDFLIIRRDDVTQYVIDILEPHSADFADNLPKAKALANYAAEVPSIGRVELIRQMKDSAGRRCFVRLNLADIRVREKLKNVQSLEALTSLFATDGVTGVFPS